MTLILNSVSVSNHTTWIGKLSKNCSPDCRSSQCSYATVKLSWRFNVKTLLKASLGEATFTDVDDTGCFLLLRTCMLIWIKWPTELNRFVKPARLCSQPLLPKAKTFFNIRSREIVFSYLFLYLMLLLFLKFNVAVFVFCYWFCY